MLVPYVRIIDGQDGGTRFVDAGETLELADFAPPAPVLGVSASLPAESVGFIGAPGGWDSPAHPAPRRQWIVMLQGTVEAITSDGEARRFGPGVAVLVEDTAGAGHRTRVVSDEPWRAMVVVLA